MSALHKFELDLTEDPFLAKILMDGKEVKGVRDIRVESTLKGPPVVTLELLAETTIKATAELVKRLTQHHYVDELILDIVSKKCHHCGAEFNLKRLPIQDNEGVLGWHLETVAGQVQGWYKFKCQKCGKMSHIDLRLE